MPTEQELQKLYDSLNEQRKTLLTSRDIAKDIQQIGEQSDLNISEINMLLNEAGLVILGIEEKDTLSDDLIEVLGIEPEKAEIIAQKITELVLSKITWESEDNTSIDEIRKALRDNSKTVNVKNIIANLK
jgi:hypothetical protein